MRALIAITGTVGLGLALSTVAGPAKAGDWSVGIGIGLPGVIACRRSQCTNCLLPQDTYHLRRPRTSWCLLITRRLIRHQSSCRRTTTADTTGTLAGITMRTKTIND